MSGLFGDLDVDAVMSSYMESRLSGGDFETSKRAAEMANDLSKRGVDSPSVNIIDGQNPSVIYEYDEETEREDVVRVALVAAENRECITDLLAGSTKVGGIEKAYFRVDADLLEEYADGDLSETEFAQSVLETWEVSR